MRVDYPCCNLFLVTQRNPTTPKLAIKATLVGAPVSPSHTEFSWDLPTQNADGSWTPGAWASVKGLVRYRKNGLHICSSKQFAYWNTHFRSKAMIAWVCEYDGHTNDVYEGRKSRNGFAARRVRLLRPWDGAEVIPGLGTDD